MAGNQRWAETKTFVRVAVSHERRRQTGNGLKSVGGCFYQEKSRTQTVFGALHATADRWLRVVTSSSLSSIISWPFSESEVLKAQGDGAMMLLWCLAAGI